MAAAATAAGFSKKTHIPVPELDPTTRQNPSKSRSSFLCKSLIVLLVLVFIPLFPSQAPDFITQTIVTEFWEIFHLVFIGIAVSYGLFSRKTAQCVSEKTLNPKNDEYLSGISHLSSIFEDGFENFSCSELSEEQNMVESHSIYGKNRFLVENIYGGNGERVSETWRSRYSRKESMVVVSDGKYLVDEISEIKPLNLPVRSLKSRVLDKDNDRHVYKKKMGNESVPKFKDSDNGDVVKIRGVVPMNLEKKFAEVAGPSPIPWRSRSVRMENREEEFEYPNTPGHYRPHSIGAFDFEQIKSRPSPSQKFSGFQELENKKRKIDLRQVSNSALSPKMDSGDANASMSGVRAQPFNAEPNGLGTFDYDCCGEQEKERKANPGVQSFGSNVKSPALAKVLSRAKSVRTVKPNRYVADGEKDSSSLINGKSEVDPLLKRERGEESEDGVFVRGRIFRMPKPRPTLSDGEKESTDDGNVSDSEEETGTGSEFDETSSENDAKTSLNSDSEFAGSEVDRKASEFIAKFKEQIRLQKTSSRKGYEGW